MFCQNCGKELLDDVKYCDQCGASIGIRNEGKVYKESKVLDKLAVITSYITSPVILILRFLLEENVRMSFGRGVIGYRMMLTPAMKIVVGLLSIGLIVFSNTRTKNQNDKNKKVNFSIPLLQ